MRRECSKVSDKYFTARTRVLLPGYKKIRLYDEYFYFFLKKKRFTNEAYFVRIIKIIYVRKDRNLYSCFVEYVLVCRGALELYYEYNSRIENIILEIEY